MMNDQNRPKILLLSGYDAPSHAYWREQLVSRLSEFDITQLILPPRYFSWRVRGSSLTWGLGDFIEMQQQYDLVLATSMVDVASLKSFRKPLARIPWVTYFHENQFAYPRSKQQQQDVNIPLTTLYSALASDAQIFNSSHNAETFFSGVERLLKQLPDQVPKNIVDQLKRSHHIIPVPLSSESVTFGKIQAGEKLKLLWNHRWEYDKNPELLLKTLECLNPNIDYEIAIVGHSFRSTPQAFSDIKSRFNRYISEWGFLEPQRYEAVLHSSNLVLSTALHDFQGLSVQQAIVNGCVPICPNRVAYPEYVSEQNLYACAEHPNSILGREAEAMAICQKLERIFKQGASNSSERLQPYLWPNAIPQYAQLFTALINHSD